MIFSSGYPKIQGASDLEDSSHLGGILAITKHPQAVDCTKYVVPKEVRESDFIISSMYHVYKTYTYVRCENTKYDFSRDQFILLAAGLIKQGHGHLVNLDYITGRDIMPPSVRGMVRVAQGKKPWPWQSLWLKAEILFHAYFAKLEEPFQIIALCSVYGDEYLKLWTKHNKLWRWSIVRYLAQLDGEWRQEKELADHVIKYVESKI